MQWQLTQLHPLEGRTLHAKMAHPIASACITRLCLTPPFFPSLPPFLSPSFPRALPPPLQVCRNQTHWGPWVPVRGRCSKFRNEQQSCNAYFAALVPGKHVAGVTTPDESSEEYSNDSNESNESSDITEHLPSSENSPEQQQQQQQQEQHQDSRVGDLLASAHRRHLLTNADIAAGAAAGVGAGTGLFSWAGLTHRQQQQQQQQQQGLEKGHHAAPGGWASHSLQGLTPQYVVSGKDGRPPARPLLCSPGLVCTGDVEPMPNTCVKVRLAQLTDMQLLPWSGFDTSR
jgi:hypothetical protein